MVLIAVPLELSAQVSDKEPASQRSQDDILRGVNSNETPKHGLRLLAVLSAPMGFAYISTDLCLPALPAMTLTLGGSTGQIEWTVS